MSESRQDIPEYVERYQRALRSLRESSSDRDFLLMRLLLMRDKVQVSLNEQRLDAPDTVFQIVELDEQLLKQAKGLEEIRHLEQWRKTISPVEDHWWWYLDRDQPPSQLERFDWIWTTLAILLFAGAISLGADIAQRFLAGGTDALSTLAVVLQSLLALLVAGGTLTDRGKQILNRLSSYLPERLQAESHVLISLLFLLVVIGLFFTLPTFARYFNNQGRDHHRAGEMLSAEYSFIRAVHLQPDFAGAHYNLGVLYEDLNDDEAALKEYRIAWKNGLDLAFSNAARLYILQEEPEQAINLLQEGLREPTNDEGRAKMLKNMGWAWVELEAYQDARPILEEALSLEPELPAAHCLLAVTLDGLEMRERAENEWLECIRLASNNSPEEVSWRTQAQKRLSAGE